MPYVKAWFGKLPELAEGGVKAMTMGSGIAYLQVPKGAFSVVAEVRAIKVSSANPRFRHTTALARALKIATA